ncbi:MAG TPA: MASE1 domain-containing protein, partial [Opitutaceae bacterium]|nr:MASE1 domain-containing protein [Opitutaceae bacterium]
MKLRFSRQALTCIAYVLLHIGAQLSATWFEVAPGISIWYPPAGLALSLLILLGPQYAPLVFLTNVVGAWETSGIGAWWAPILYPALITLNYAAAAYLVRRLVGPKLTPGTTRETIVFALTILSSPVVVAFVGSAISVAIGIATPAIFFRSSLNWWIGDVNGLLTVVPVIMGFVAPWLQSENSNSDRRDRSHRTLLVISQATVLLISIVLVFLLNPLTRHDALYLCFAPLIWIGLSHGLRGVTLATLLITMGTLLGLHLEGNSADLTLNFLIFEVTVTIVGLGLGSAVTRRNVAEKKLAESEARFDRVIAGAQLGLWDWNVATQQATYNRHWAEMVGYDLESCEPIVRTWQKLIHPADIDRVGHAWAIHAQGNAPLYEAEFRMRTKQKEWRWIYSRGSIVARDANEQPLLVSGTHQDITDRKQAEAEARRLLEIIEATTDFVLTTDPEGRILYANASLMALFGVAELSQLSGRRLIELVPNIAASTIQQRVFPTVLANGVWHGEIWLRDTQGSDIPVSQVVLAHRNSANEIATLSFVMRDISRQKQTEAENIENERKILLVQKSESLGALAGGIAHDFNNLLTAMLGNADLVRLRLPADSPLHAPLSRIESAARRAAELCQQMLAYAGRSPLTFSEVDLTAVVEETKQLLNVSIGKKIHLDLQLTRPLAPIRAAASQIQQITMNLALNASEAIGDNEGHIVIKTSDRHFSAEEINQRFKASLATGHYVLLEVSDSGCGMTPEIQARIFEPFFTTKFTGHGLGLAAVMGIVKSHGGVVRVSSGLGKGTSFQILLPAAERSERPTCSELPRSEDWQGSGLALIVDDETEVRDIVAHMVESLGFKTVLASDGLEALVFFRKNASSLNLVLLDLTMPKMDGGETFNEMQRIGP